MMDIFNINVFLVLLISTNLLVPKTTSTITTPQVLTTKLVPPLYKPNIPDDTVRKQQHRWNYYDYPFYHMRPKEPKKDEGQENKFHSESGLKNPSNEKTFHAESGPNNPVSDQSTFNSESRLNKPASNQNKFHDESTVNKPASDYKKFYSENNMDKPVSASKVVTNDKTYQSTVDPRYKTHKPVNNIAEDRIRTQGGLYGRYNKGKVVHSDNKAESVTEKAEPVDNPGQNDKSFLNSKNPPGGYVGELKPNKLSDLQNNYIKSSRPMFEKPLSRKNHNRYDDLEPYNRYGYYYPSRWMNDRLNNADYPRQKGYYNTGDGGRQGYYGSDGYRQNNNDLNRQNNNDLSRQDQVDVTSHKKPKQEKPQILGSSPGTNRLGTRPVSFGNMPDTGVVIKHFSMCCVSHYYLRLISRCCEV